MLRCYGAATSTIQFEVLFTEAKSYAGGFKM